MFLCGSDGRGNDFSFSGYFYFCELLFSPRNLELNVFNLTGEKIRFYKGSFVV